MEELGVGYLLGAMLPIRVCSGAQEAEFAFTVSNQKDVSYEENSHLCSLVWEHF